MMAHFKTLLCCLGLGLMCYGCTPSSSEEFQKEGEALCQSLVDLLQEAQTSEQLVAMEPALKKRFESLVSLMMEASRFREKSSEEWDDASVSEPRFASAALKEQLQRLYGMEGGRELIERAQHESLVKLDAYERSRLKQREKLPLN